MGMHPVLEWDLFGHPEDPKDRELSQKSLLVALEALTHRNQLYLKNHPKTPPIYRAPVRYEREMGTELWSDIPTILKKGYGDCEDMAGWRVAELRENGHRASPYVRYKKVDGKYHYHALVKRAGQDAMTGQHKAWIEDPSRRLGMGWESQYAELMKKRGIVPRSAMWDLDENQAMAGIGWGGMGECIAWKPVDRIIRPAGVQSLYRLGMMP